MPNGSRDGALFDGRFIGVILLVIVNILWVLSAEITRFIFVDEDFKRPFFTVYVKTCLLSIYLLKYFCCSKPPETYQVLENNLSEESFDMGQHTLALEGFETVSGSDSELDEDLIKKEKKIRFASKKEVRRLPSHEADEARKARLPYARSICEFEDFCVLSTQMKNILFVFGPIWLVSSFTYQAGLLFTSVSSLNLVSSSSSLFVLVLNACIPSSGSSFTLYKGFLVVLNIGGVVAVSKLSANLTGVMFAQISAVAYALYLTLYSRYQDNHGVLDMNLMMGTIGILCVFIGSPIIYILDSVGWESLYPLPTQEQFGSIILSAIIGTLIADYLWLLAAGLTDPLLASISVTLSIPLSFLADTVFRQRPPNAVQLIAAIPIGLSFIGAALTETARRPTSGNGASAAGGISNLAGGSSAGSIIGKNSALIIRRRGRQDEEAESLLEDVDDDDES
ncbi:unnamed protein product [Auanema sp. JU1783]|nr:unnamed protein product [Auanema sp. JU1783]